MKPFCLAFLTAALSLGQYTGPKTVYILPMSGGLDQYLAQWLTKDHLMRVVADPHQAEVVMTDTLGEPFEQKMKQLLPPDASKKTVDNPTPHTFQSSKRRGTIFIVDAKSRQVVWSDYQKPANSTSDKDLNNTAAQIAKKIAGPPPSGK
jgi:hypothetical protein